jgi:predicted transcriptional regulator
MRSTDMSPTTVRISSGVRSLLRELARVEQSSMQAVLERALEQYRRRRFIERVNDGYASIRADAASAASLAEEQAAWEGVVADGLDDSETWSDAGAVAPRSGRSRRK